MTVQYDFYKNPSPKDSKNGCVTMRGWFPTGLSTRRNWHSGYIAAVR